nr:Gag-Pol polyprotein [Tanacetum cinerariifolium]
MTFVKQSQELKTVSYHKLYDILKQYQNEVNEIRAERLAHHNKLLPETKEKQLSTLLHPLSFKKIYKPTNNNLRTSSNTSRANQDNSPRINRGTGMGMSETETSKGCSLSQGKDVIELEAHYIYMAQIQEVNPDAVDNSGPIFNSEPLQKHNVIIDSLDMSYDREQVDQDDDDDLAKECDLLASLIEKLKCEIDDSQNQMKKKLLAHQETISILLQQKEAQIKFHKTREDKELDKVIALENKVKVLDNIVYKTGQTIQTMNMLNRNCKTSFAKPEFLKKSQRANPRLYDIGCYNDNLALMLAPESDEDLKAQLQDKAIAISELKKLIEKLKGKSVDTKFVKSSVIHQPNGFKSQRPSILGKPTIFSDSLERKDCSKSKPQLKGNPIEDRVMLNNSQGKKQKVEDHRRNVKFSKNKTSVTACNDSLNAKTLNVNFVCVTCGKCMLNGKHDMCILHSFNGVNSRTNKMPMVVPVSFREPKRIVNQSVAKPLRRTVASESTSQKPRNITRKLYEHVTKTCSWWYPKFTPPGYKWKPKSQIGNVNPNLVEIILFIVDSRCSKHMTGNLKLLTNFVEKFLGSRGTDLYSITLQDTASPNPICLMAKATSYTWTRFLRSKDETPEVLIDFLRLVHRRLHAQVRIVRTDKGTEFLNKTLHAYFASEGINHQTSVARTPEQNGVVERRNRTLVEAARTMLSAAKEKGDACIFVGYSTQSRAYRVFNKRTRVIIETIHVNFDELPQMASDHVSYDPVPQSGTVTTSNELNLLFSPMFDELLNRSSQVVLKSSAETTVDAPNKCQQLLTTLLNTHTTPEPICQVPTQAPTLTSTENINQAETITENAQVEDDEFINIFSTPVQDRGETSSRHVDSSNIHTFYQRHPSEHRWTKDHPLEQVIGNPSQSVRTRRQLESDGKMCMFTLTVSQTKPKNIKEAMADSAWIKSMQEELHQFDRLDLTDYGFHFDKIPMYCDSKAAIAILCNPVQHSRTKHIDVRYHFIKEKVEKGIVELFFVGTKYQLADMFTKALSEERFKYLVRRLGMRCLTPEELEVLANESA